VSRQINNPVERPAPSQLVTKAGRLPRIAMACGGVAVLGMLGGCYMDQSFMDPSVAGRWKPTPTIMPVLDRIAAIEDDTGEMVETTDPVPGDLIPLPVSYRIGAGDQLDVTLYDLIETNRPELYQVVVDARGYIELPQLGRINVSNLTTEEATEAIKASMRRLVAEPLVLVVAKAQRQQTFNIIGAVESPGPYFIPRADYRLLEALTAGGRIDESIEQVFIIRQIPLTEDVSHGQGLPNGAAPNAPANPANPANPSGEKPKDLMNVINEIAPPEKSAPATQPPPPPPPPAAAPADQNAPAKGPEAAIPLPGSEPAKPAANPAPTPGAQPTDNQPKPPPAIELPDSSKPTPAAPGAETKPTDQGGGWIFVNGKWVQAQRTHANEAGRSTPPTQELITQRIIRVPLKPLLQGKQSYNIVVRPGDVVHVPQPPNGLVYMSGQVARPGPYTLPTTGGGLTITRAIDAAGGFGTIAIPERIEITRMLDKNREATIMVDGRAISEHTQPDVYLKPNDRINVGTTWWALPLAVIRNGFRASYGFGFVMDRNIADDIFGPVPVNNVNTGG
jgi:protein involved in polysaccharide export with SLBB domain